MSTLKMIKPIFIHSLFRSGSTYLYNALKRTEKYHVYHEPFHEVIGKLPSEWSSLIARTEESKVLLRHEFLIGSYFDEFAHLLPQIKKHFHPDISYQLFFLDKKDDSPVLKSYIDCLISGSRRQPVFQCTRTLGRVRWLKNYYSSKHVFLLRNPWDQWFSYKVDSYISSTPQLIYSHEQLPSVLREVIGACGYSPIQGGDDADKINYALTHPLTPDVDYFLFFGLWLFSLITAREECDLILDMDSISNRMKSLRQREKNRNRAKKKLKKIGLKKIELHDCMLPRAVFKPGEIKFYREIEEQIFELFRRNGPADHDVRFIQDYLASERKISFSSGAVNDRKIANVLEDASRLRSHIIKSGRDFVRSVKSVHQAVEERNGQLDRLKKEVQALSDQVRERDQSVQKTSAKIAEQEQSIQTLSTQLAERDQAVQALSTKLAETDRSVQTLSDQVVERDRSLHSLLQFARSSFQFPAQLEEKDQWIQNLSAKLAERDQLLQNLSDQLAQRDQSIQTLSVQAAERDQSLHALSAQLSERDQSVQALADQLAERDQSVQALADQLAEHNQSVQALAAQLAERDQKAQTLSIQLAERDQSVQALADQLAERNQSVQALADQVTKRNQLIQSLSIQLAERDQSTQALSDQLAERDQKAQTLLIQLAERDQKAQAFSIQLVERDQSVQSLSTRLAERDQSIQALSTQLAERDQSVQVLSIQLADIKSSKTWKMALLFRKVRVLLAPPSSCRTRALRLLNNVLCFPVIKSRRNRISEADLHLIKSSGLFNESWYLAHHPDVAQAKVEPLLHYVHVGGFQGRDPGPNFSSSFYLHSYKDVQRAGINPLIHYLKHGRQEGRAVQSDPASQKPTPPATKAQAQLPQSAASHPRKIVLFLKETRQWFINPWFLTKRCFKVLAKLTKAGYLRIPFSQRTKNTHRRLLTKYAPGVLRASDANPIAVPVLPPPGLGVAPSLADFASLAEAIKLTTSLQPVVSVIIPIYGKCDFTLRCLSSIARNTPSTPFEVIVVNDCSPDDSAAVLRAIPGLRMISSAKNHGFIRSCNFGAKAAKGRFLCFLNNDTEVTGRWLDELLRTFHEFPDTGLVGSKLVYPDGTLQEAGGIIWQDGSAWNFGHRQDPLLPVYNYAREVDYCSGASIMVPRELFKALGGFDEHYLPAYCEDSDLALKIRERGYRVIYQPLSVVVHHEGVTSGTDTIQGVKAYQVGNSRKLYERWKGRLRRHQPPGADIDRAKDRMAKRRVLVLDHCTPTPNQDAGSVTAFNLLMLLREMDFQVTFIPEDNFLYMPVYTPALQRAGIEVLYAPYCRSVEKHLKESGGRYDLAFLFRPGVVKRHLDAVRKHSPQAKVLFDTQDLHYLRMSREAALFHDEAKRKAADEMRRLELAAIRAVDATIVHSTSERELLRRELPGVRIHVCPLILNTFGTEKAFPERRDVVFVGGYQHTPNVDAVLFFVNEIMPLLRRRLPGVRFYAVGSKTPAEIQALAGEDVIITGLVEDLPSLFDQMRVSVAPLRYGAGVKGKIGTAMSVGLPTVATSLAVEGMSLTDGKNILVADGAEPFAEAVARLYEDETLWNNVSQAGLTFAENTMGPEAAWAALNSILTDLGLPCLRGSRPLILFGQRFAIPHFSQRGKPSPTADLMTAREYAKKAQYELSIYEKQEKVHDLPDIFHFWSNTYLLPIIQSAGYQSIEQFFTMNLFRSWKHTESTHPRFLSIGSGNCDFEVSIIQSLIKLGCDHFLFDCIDLNPVMLDRGRTLAAKQGVQEFMRFIETDFNTWNTETIYHGIMANHSLHHVLALEHLFQQVKTCLHDKGAFIVNDMIGRNGHQRWPESLAIVHRYWKELPEDYKYNLLLNRYEHLYENWDCSIKGFEGIREQDILPLLLKLFTCEKFIPFGNAIDVFIDRCFGHHFDQKKEWDRNFIDRVHREDERGFHNGQLTPTHMLAVFVKYPVDQPYNSRNIAPEVCVKRNGQ